MDPRYYFYSQVKQRRPSPTYQSDRVASSMLNFLGGPLNPHPHSSTGIVSASQQPEVPLSRAEPQGQSPMKRYADLLFAQHQIELTKSMLKKSYDIGPDVHKKDLLGLSDKDRFYYRRTGSYDYRDPSLGNEHSKFMDRPHRQGEQIYGRHSIPVTNIRSRGSGGEMKRFKPGLLNNADELTARGNY